MNATCKAPTQAVASDAAAAAHACTGNLIILEVKPLLNNSNQKLRAKCYKHIFWDYFILIPWATGDSKGQNNNNGAKNDKLRRKGRERKRKDAAREERSYSVKPLTQVACHLFSGKEPHLKPAPNCFLILLIPRFQPIFPLLEIQQPRAKKPVHF